MVEIYYNIIQILYMDNISGSLNSSIDKINKMYGDLNYYDVYGGSVMIFIILIIILLLVYSYTSIMVNVEPIKKNWAVERCNPKVIPFAGFINKPDNVSAIKYTEDNFNYCMQNILTSIAGYALEPVTFITYGLTSLYKEIAGILNSIRVVISNVRTNMEKIAKEIFGRLLNIMPPIQTLLITFIDVTEKVKGIFTAGLYTSLGTYYALKSLMGAIVQFIVLILLVLAGLIAGLWIVPFTWPFAISGTVTFLSISIPLLLIMLFMNEVLHVNINSPIPSVPQPGECFDKGTLFLIDDGSYVSIENLKVGDKLANSGTVTAKLKLDASKAEMYQLGDVIVSGSHQVKHNGKWIFVKNHPERKPILSYLEPYIYCLNTSLKKIQLSGYDFSDWDEVFDEEKKELLLDDINTELIHKYYDGGFYFDTKIELENGGWREIRELSVGDILADGTKVVGLVEIWNDNLGQNNSAVKINGINVHSVDFNKNIDLENNIREKKIFNNDNNDNDNKKLYHLITDRQSFFVGNVKYYHYNSCIELFLEKYRGKLLSIKYV